ncbi:23147_t:CDS:2 [Gigaspora margarita]|uniref:23147_t:CDS:1 n=1 Tax=Gigaspora margarita TaxID=4874 RepID=A0ABN7UJZ9_GIGMA|nr:23147_t:CDS:2 [Gigaspora margarita]
MYRGSAVRSWIWLYFEAMYEEGIRVAICKVETVKEKITSTSNCATHLNNVHGITEEQAKNNLVSFNIPYNES